MQTDFPHVCEAITGKFFRHGYVINCPSTYCVGVGIESLWWRDFPYPSTPALGSTQPPVVWVEGLFRRAVERPGRDFDHPSHLAPKLEKE